MLQTYLDRISAIVGEPVKLYRYMNKGCEEVTIDNGYYYVASNVTAPDLLFYIRKVSNNNEVAQFGLVTFPGCCGLVISTGAYTQPPFRNQGISQIALSLREDICKRNGYTVLVCTDVDKNAPQRKILSKAGFKDIYQFVNRRTANLVNISVKNLV